MSNAGSSAALHTSDLADPRQRLLSRVLAHAFADGWRTPDDFLKHFPPADLVSSLANSPDLRVKLLVAATGMHEKIAAKKTVSSATEDLELALDEGATTPAALVALYPADEQVRHLDAARLWTFAFEDEFFLTRAGAEGSRHARAAARLSFIVDCALTEGILTLRDVADGLGFDTIAAALPVEDVRKVTLAALELARSGAPLTEERLLAVVPLSAILSHVELAHSWQRVVVDRVAVPAGFVADAGGADLPSVPAPAAPPPPAPEAASPSVVDVQVTVEAPEGAAPKGDDAPRADDDEVRRRVIERLRLIDRLPPNLTDLSTALLLSVESMYADLWAVSDDEEREACIRESFPNQSHLRTAMLALIELLDPTVDTRDPIIRDADVSGLIKIVLFEERRRRDVGPPSARRASAAPVSRARRSVPPPLPRSSTPPPLPSSVDATARGSNPPPLPAEAGSKRET